MKSILMKCCFVLLLTSGIFAISSTAEAYYYTHCRYVAGHKYHGHWVPKHVVCYEKVRHCGYSCGYSGSCCGHTLYPRNMVVHGS